MPGSLGGANPALLLTVYMNLIRSYLEWGAPLFRCADGSALGILDRAQFGALRVALGCMRTTPTSVLLSEAGELPLSLGRSLLSGRFILRSFLPECFGLGRAPPSISSGFVF